MITPGPVHVPENELAASATPAKSSAIDAQTMKGRTKDTARGYAEAAIRAAQRRHSTTYVLQRSSIRRFFQISTETAHVITNRPTTK